MAKSMQAAATYTCTACRKPTTSAIKEYLCDTVIKVKLVPCGCETIIRTCRG